MSNAARKIEEYRSLKPSRFDLVSNFKLMQIVLDEGFDLQLMISLASSIDTRVQKEELLLVFVGVRNIELAQKGPAFQRCLEIRDVSNRQWDRIFYEVKDTEHGVLSFLCRDFSCATREVAGPIE